jgi:hypothetical protein
MPRISCLLAALSMLVLLTPLAVAQGDGFAAFWKEFSGAAARKDKEKIRALTQYPSPEFERKNFDVIWKEMFPPRMLACLAKAKPERDTNAKPPNYVAFCKSTIYGFEHTPQGWRFAWTHPDD